MKKPIDENLLNKIKEGLIKSGFPLELQIAKIMQEKDWSYSISSQYVDFETNKLRESDIIADKVINGIQVNLMIECKKSDDKQLILYQPKQREKGWFSFYWAKAFPEIDAGRFSSVVENISREFSRLPVLSKNYHFSNSIILVMAD